MRYAVKDLVARSYYKIDFSGNTSLSSDLFITSAAPISEAKENDITWIKPGIANANLLLQSTNAKAILCDRNTEKSFTTGTDKLLLVTENPKLTFAKIIEDFFTAKVTYGIHPTAIIDPMAIISDQVQIGPYAVVGKATIASGTIIGAYCKIGDNVSIGRNVIIGTHCIIGEDGFSFARKEDGSIQKFPHIGGVIIADDVEIYKHTIVDRGVLGNTIIGQGTKIDSSCMIAHNCRIGKNNMFAAGCVLAGSVRVGDNCWFSIGTLVRNQLEIGNNVFLGQGSVVLRNVKDNITTMGNPAREISKHLEIQMKLNHI